MRDFQRLLKNLKEAGKFHEIDQAIFYRCATDLELFAHRFFPHYCKHPFAKHHFEDFQSFKYGERAIRRVRAAPRGYAKSTLKVLVKPIHDLVYGLEKYIVVFSNTEQQALGKLKDIRNELLENRLLINFYGINFKNNRIAEGTFTAFAGDHRCKFEAYGTGAQIRGIRDREARPTKLIFDDVEHSTEVDNEALRTKYDTWYTSDVLKAGDETTNVEFVGTVLHRRSLLSNLLKNPLYDAKKYQAVISWSEREDLWTSWRDILSNLDNDNRLTDAKAFYESNRDEMLRGTKVLWPEKEPYVALMTELLETGRLAFFKEKQNDPLGAEDKVFTQFHWYREIVDEKRGRGILIEKTGHFIPWDRFKYFRTYGAMDPSTGQVKARAGKMGDFTCILTGKVDDKGRLFVHSDWTKRVPPTVYIQAVFDLHEQWEYEKFGVETNLYRNLLVPNLLAHKKKLEDDRKTLIKLPFYDIEQVENKEKRIFTLEPKVTNGWILLNRNLSQEFFNQLDEFPKADHDDVPDTLEALWGMANGRYKMSPVGINAMGGR